LAKNRVNRFGHICDREAREPFADQETKVSGLSGEPGLSPRNFNAVAPPTKHDIREKTPLTASEETMSQPPILPFYDPSFFGLIVQRGRRLCGRLERPPAIIPSNSEW
jgi:hypothetical protein